MATDRSGLFVALLGPGVGMALIIIYMYLCMYAYANVPVRLRSIIDENTKYD